MYDFICQKYTIYTDFVGRKKNSFLATCSLILRGILRGKSPPPPKFLDFGVTNTAFKHVPILEFKNG